ncbi:CAP domain-containing protein [Streptacidiphilus monticola]|uniref:CAP domain-containing protein n=1 Tax=Streptacidiphilus monticola TaxID=2161674 RepID=A0ABW1FY27_9ACTN
MPRHARTPAPAPVPADSRRAANSRRRRRAKRLRGSLLLCCLLLAAGAGGVLGGVVPLPPGVSKSLALSGDSATQAVASTTPGGHPTSPSTAASGAAPVVAGTTRVTPAPSASSRPASPSASADPSPAPPSATASHVAAVSTPSTPATTADPVAAAQAEVLRLVNIQRAQAGCGALKASKPLDGLAQSFSHEMAVRNFFSHTDPDGKTPWDRAKALGITNLGGENIARGQQTPAAVMDAWMHSPGHRANILNCSYHSLGVGAYFAPGGPWWTQDFGF